MSKRSRRIKRQRRAKEGQQVSSAARKPSAKEKAQENDAPHRKPALMPRIGVGVVVLSILAGLYMGLIRPNRAQAVTPSLPETTEEEAMSWNQAPSMTLTPGTNYQAIIHTEKGDIHIDLFQDQTPVTVNNFVFLAREGFYDGVTFHRVIPGFMAQTGDPTGTGAGGPGYTFEDEFVPELRHDQAGTISMANRGPNTNGSQIFITYAPTPHLDGAHAVFGRVIEGIDVLQSISPRDPGRSRTPGDRIDSVEIIELE